MSSEGQETEVQGSNPNLLSNDTFDRGTTGWTLMPPAKHLCQTCATDHNPCTTHNPQTMFYQSKRHMDGLEPGTWEDAMAHCDEETKALWREQLTSMGVDTTSSQLTPKVGRQILLNAQRKEDE